MRINLRTSILSLATVAIALPLLSTPTFAYACDDRETEKLETLIIKAILGNSTGLVNMVISNAIGRVTTPNGINQVNDAYTGLSAGDDMDTPWGSWATVSWTDMNNTLSSTKFDGNMYNLVAGIDMTHEDIVLGAALSYENSDIDTKFNDGKSENDGYMATLYGAWIVNDKWVIDSFIGYGLSDNDVDNGTATGSYDSTRRMYGINANYYHFIDKWSLNGTIGYLWAKEVSDSHTLSDATTVSSQDTHLGEARLGGRVGYTADQYEPFLSLAILHDNIATHEEASTGAQPANDPNELEAVIGVNAYLEDDMEAGLEVSHGFFRDDVRNTTVLFNFRANF
ncbi:MAG: autotransporter outer membrane beta-barrel domain-containing protein [Pseudomonadota bacterium]|nr:autotransporter outer membrane beta-barrel domain-containing protein [Pseudomonadota bacterium]